jgi:hypothetical protein
LTRRGPAVDALARSLAFQFGDWTLPPPSDIIVEPVGSVSGIPAGADRELVLEAQAVGAHVFLTRDQAVLDRAVVTGPRLRLLRPSELADGLLLAGVRHFSGGLCRTDGCPYAAFRLLAPDMGKWSGLLSAFEGG